MNKDDRKLLRMRQWKVFDREESFLLGELLWYRVRPNGIHSDDFHDPKSVEPEAWSRLKNLRGVPNFLIVEKTLSTVEDFIVPDIVFLYDRMVEIAERNNIPIVASRATWFSGKSDEVELRRMRLDSPTDLTYALVGNSIEILLYILTLKICMAPASDWDDRLSNVLSKIPAILLPTIREAREILLANREPISDFMGWIIQRSSGSVMRTEIMEELDRRWKEDKMLRGWARNSFESLEANGRIVRMKKGGKLAFVSGTLS